MANKNKKAIDKMVQNIKLQGFQLVVSESNPNNYIKFNYAGYSMPISQFSSKDFADLIADLEQAKTDAEIQACMSGSSKACMKIDEAHGRTVQNSFENYVKQSRTYAKSHRAMQQLKGVSLKKALTDYVEDIESSWYNSKEHFLQNIPLWHEDLSKDELIAFIQNMLMTKQIYFVNGYVYTRLGLYNLIKNWHGQNDIQTSKDEINSIIDKCFKGVGVGV